MKKEMDLYSDYLLSSFGKVTATGLSNLLDGVLSHDKITRLLSGNELNSKALWQEAKPLVREYENEEACLIFDDTIVNKPYMDENDCWHQDYIKGCNEKDINLLTSFYHIQSSIVSKAIRVPEAFECVKKTVWFSDEKMDREKRQSPVTKNEMVCSMLKQAVENQHLKFRYVLAGCRFSSSDNLLFIHRSKKYFVMDMKNNRLCMFSMQDKNRGQLTSLGKLPLQFEQLVKIWIKDLAIESQLCKFGFTDKDSSTGEQNDSKSSARAVTTQTGHLFASLLAYIKLEYLKFAHNKSQN